MMTFLFQAPFSTDQEQGRKLEWTSYTPEVCVREEAVATRRPVIELIGEINDVTLDKMKASSTRLVITIFPRAIVLKTSIFPTPFSYLPRCQRYNGGSPSFPNGKRLCD